VSVRSLGINRGAAVQEFSRAWRFATVGAFGALTNTFLLWLLTERAALYYLASSVVATEITILSNFTLNHNWTFARERDGQSFPRRLLKFNLVSIGGLALTVATLFALKQFVGLHYLVANAAAVVAGAGWNYVANRRWTWRIAPVLSA
jgi:dolichol-phosphate mannosyltransferase